MAYARNNLIEASHFNTFRTDVLNVYGVGNGSTGYGQTAITIPSITGGGVKMIESAEWVALRNAIEACVNHQGVGASLLPPLSALQPDEIARAHPPSPGSFPGVISSISTNRFAGPASSYTLTSNVSTTSRTVAWANKISCDFTITFSSPDNARYFFNSGGQIRIRASRSGGTSTSQNTSWTNMLNSMGTFRMNYNNSASLSGTGTPGIGGYYQLPTGTISEATNRRLYRIFGSGVYSTNNLAIYGVTNGTAGSNGANGNVIILKIVLTDAYGGSTSVSGTTTIRLDLYKATSHLTIATPSVTLSAALGGT